MENWSPLPVSVSASDYRSRVNAFWQRYFVTLWQLVGRQRTAGSTGLEQSSGPRMSWNINPLEAGDTAEALGFSGTSGPEQAQVFFCRALSSAVADLVQEADDLFPDQLLEERHLEKLTGKLPLIDSESELHLEPNNFDRPQHAGIFVAVRRCLVQWLQGMGLTHAIAEALGRRLPGYFFHALQEEWFSHPSFYSALVAQVNSPFLASSREQNLWRRYSSSLLRKIDHRMLDEAFGLREVYVPPRASVYHPKPISDDPHRQVSPEAGKPVVVDLGKELLRWIYVPEASDSLRLITGEQGSGKTSFTSALAAKLSGSYLFPEEQSARVSFPVLYVDLEELRFRGDFESAIGAYAAGFGLPHDLLARLGQGNRILLILDGLDQLWHRGNPESRTGEMRDLLIAVEDTAARLAERGAVFQAIITAATLPKRGLPESLEIPGRHLELLPFYLPKEEHRAYRDDSAMLYEDQRETWWKSFQEARGLSVSGLPEELTHADLHELTYLPLQNYLTALAWYEVEQEGTGEITARDIFRSLIQRGFRKAQLRDPSLTLEKFESQMEKLALASWRSHAQPILIESVPDPILLDQVFFRPAKTDSGDRGIVFHPQRMGDYLVSRRLAKLAEQLADSRAKELHSESLLEEATFEERALRAWSQITADAPLNAHHGEMLAREIAALPGDRVGAIQETVTALIDYCLREGMVLRGGQGSHAKEVIEKARNAEEALLCLLNACTHQTQTLARIEWPTADSARAWFHRLMGTEERFHLLRWLDYLDLAGCQLMGIDLIGASMRHCDLTGASLRGANLAEADLSHALMAGIDLFVADLAAATLYAADLNEADFRGAVLRAVNLRRANLTKADFRGATLHGANLSMANLSGADLDGADLENADLEDADISGTLLQEGIQGSGESQAQILGDASPGR